MAWKAPEGYFLNWYRKKRGVALDTPKYFKRTPLDRWLNYVQFQEDSECWLWVGHIAKTGYAAFGGQKWAGLAHRFSYVTFVSEIPKGLQLDHLCRIRHCVNPDHLEAVTPQVNTLRGNTSAAKNAAKTHCHRGHPFNSENTYMWAGKRCCRACKKIHKQTYKEAYCADEPVLQ
jgi:HNH endonuclease